MLLILLAAAAAPAMSGEDVLTSLKAAAEVYEARPTCSVTVAALISSEGDDGPTNEDLLFRFDHTTDEWTVLQATTSEDDDEDESETQRPRPRDWYARALTIATAAETVTPQEDGSFLLLTEDIPKGTLMDQAEGRDNSKRSRAETVVTAMDGTPVIASHQIMLKKPFRIPLIVRVKDYREEVTFGASDDYGPLATSRTNSWDVSFTGGSERGTATATYTDYECPA